MKNPLVPIATILGFVFVVLAVMYFFTPAGSLPSFVPGYQIGSQVMHYKHALLSLILGVLLFVYVWFKR